LENCNSRPMQPMSAIRGGMMTELRAWEGEAGGGAGLDRGGSTGAGGGSR
jgi:hypothetical protein